MRALDDIAENANRSELGVREFTGRHGLTLLEPAWRSLVDGAARRGVHHAFEVQLSYLEHVSPAPDAYLCLGLVIGSELAAICPFEPKTMKILGRRTSAWVMPHGFAELARDVIGDSKVVRSEVLRHFVRHLGASTGQAQWLVLENIAAGSCVWESLHRLPAHSFVIHVTGAADTIDCERSFDALVTSLSPKFRRNLRSAQRKLEALPDVRFVIARDPSGIRREFDAFLELEVTGWKGTGGTNTALHFTSQLREYVRTMLDRFGARGMAEVNALYADGRCVASQLCVREGGDYVVLKLCYDEQYSQMRPGHLLLQNTLQRCCENPEVQRLNLVSHQEWHRDWHPDVQPRYTAYIGIVPWYGPILASLLRLSVNPRVKRFVPMVLLLPRVLRRWLR